jgi:trimethylamine--corrinoid protein Co-methyltransferase
MPVKLFAGLDMVQGARLELLSRDALDRINSETMDVLKTSGVGVYHEEALEIFKKGGCDVDPVKRMVRIPEHIVKDALHKCPGRVLLAGREKGSDVLLEAGRKVGNTTFGTGLYTYEYETNSIRESNNQDVYEAAVLADWCSTIDFFSLPCAARELLMEGLASDVHETFTSWVGTRKHFHHVDPVAEHMEYYFKMGVAYYGGDEEAFRKRPIISVLLCPTSPLQLHANACGVIIQGARYDIPVNVLSMAMSGATGPVTLAGTLVTHNAEVLSGIVLAQLTEPGAPVIYGSSTTMFDLRTATAPVGAPELGLISAAVSQLAQYYGLPSYVAGT